MPASEAGGVSSAFPLPFCCAATWPPAPQMKLTIPLVKSLGAPRPNVPGNFFCSSLASASSAAQVVGADVMPALVNSSLRYQMPRTPPNHGTAKLAPLTVSLARLPLIMVAPGPQDLTLVVMLA